MLTTLLTWIMTAPKMAGGRIWQCEVKFPGEAVLGAKALGPCQNRISIDFRHLPDSLLPGKAYENGAASATGCAFVVNRRLDSMGPRPRKRVARVTCAQWALGASGRQGQGYLPFRFRALRAA
jgi:hypothetical protein